MYGFVWKERLKKTISWEIYMYEDTIFVLLKEKHIMRIEYRGSVNK